MSVDDLPRSVNRSSLRKVDEHITKGRRLSRRLSLPFSTILSLPASKSAVALTATSEAADSGTFLPSSPGLLSEPPSPRTRSSSTPAPSLSEQKVHPFSFLPPTHPHPRATRTRALRISSTPQIETRISLRIPETDNESEDQEINQLDSCNSWKATLLLDPKIQTRRDAVIEDLNRQFGLKVCWCCWKNTVDQLELFSISALFTLEILNYATIFVNERRFRPIRAQFVAHAESWKNYTLLTTMVQFGEIVSMIEYAMSAIDNPVAIMHNNTPWTEIILKALACDMEEFSDILFHVMKKEDMSELMLSQVQKIADAAHLAFRYCGTGSRPFDRALKIIAEKTGILPSYIFIPGIKKMGDNPVVGGGFADVWKGDLNGTPLALKVLRVFLEVDRDKFQTALSKEALLWRRLNHPNVLPFLGICQDVFEPRLALVSRWMPNGNLFTCVREPTFLDHERMVKGVASGIHYLHELKPQIIHGDLRAANVLIDEDLEPRITDFGLSRAIDSQASTVVASSFHGKGTLRWQAPELLNVSRFQEEGRTTNISTKSDVYAFACLCLEVFTGDIPFSKLLDGAVIMEVAVHDRRPPRPDPSIVTERGLDDAFWEMMQLCWKTLPADRPDMSWVVDWFANEGHNTPSEEIGTAL